MPRRDVTAAFAAPSGGGGSGARADPAEAPPEPCEGARTLRLLFLGSANAARSILAEAIANHDHSGRLIAHSAGARPAREIHPAARALLQRLNYPTASLRPKPWTRFARADAPPLDVVVSLSEAVLRRPRPVWPGAPVAAHWDLPDPERPRDGRFARQLAFAYVFRILDRRIGALARLSPAELAPAALQQRLDEIGGEPTEWG